MDNQTILSIRDLRVVFEDGFTALGGVSIDIGENEFVTLLGPSGCGKTTLLRCIGGFEKPTGGEILYKGQNIIGLPPYKRAINTVFQRYALFPHLNVAQNVAFGPDLRKEDKKKTAEEVSRMLALVGLAGFEKRRISSLSGGQQQRVAIARALINKPDVLLLDEPLGALDLKLRREMQLELKRIQRESGITFIFVTHDQEEALSMSDTIVVLSEGRIQQIGTPKHIYQRPANEFVSSFIGLSNFVDAENENGTLDFGCGYRVPMTTLRPDAGRKVCVAVRPEEFLIRSAEEPGIPATVRSSVFLGMTQHYFLTLGEEKEIEVVVPSDRSDLIPDGEKVSLQIVADKVNVFDGESRATVIREGV